MDIILSKMFDSQRWEDLMVKAVDKGINKNALRELCKPEQRLRLYYAIKERQYEIAPPHIAQIPKDDGTFREVYVNEDIDRIFLSLANDILFELCGDLIHPSCKSYQKGKSCGATVQEVAKQISTLHTSDNAIGYKVDLSKYFDSVLIEFIDQAFEVLEATMYERYGLELNSPVMEIIKHYYHNDLVFDVNGELIEHYGSLKQGCAVASFLADYILQDIDTALNNMNIIYYRYSDDIVMIGEEADKAKEVLEEMLNEKGLVLNPKKVEKLYNDKWFTFLGYKIKGNQITLSKNRVKTFQKEIEARTIKQKSISYNKAKRAVYQYLYKSTEDKNYGWAQQCLPIITVEKDVIELDNFVKDCLRACATHKKKLGGLGSVNDRDNCTIIRGKGKNVKTNKQKIPVLDGYMSINCLRKAIQQSKGLFQTLVTQLC